MSYDLDDWHDENCSKPYDDDYETSNSSDDQEYDEYYNQTNTKNQTKESKWNIL